jgi:hypothetical protein
MLKKKAVNTGRGSVPISINTKGGRAGALPLCLARFRDELSRSTGTGIGRGERTAVLKAMGPDRSLSYRQIAMLTLIPLVTLASLKEIAGAGRR